MHEFRVWAPDARRAEVVLGTRRLALAAAGHGWWAGRVADAGPGSDYMFAWTAARRGPTRGRPASRKGCTARHG